MNEEIYKIYDKISVATCNFDRLKLLCEGQADKLCLLHYGCMSEAFVSPHDIELCRLPTLKEIYRFCETINCIKLKNQDKHLIISSGSYCEKAISDLALHIGSFGLIIEDLEEDKVLYSLQPVICKLSDWQEKKAIKDALGAISHVKNHCRWINNRFGAPATCPVEPSLTDEGDAEAESNSLYSTFDMEQYAHYDSPLNGYFQIMVPNHVIIFDPPSNELVRSDMSYDREIEEPLWRDISDRREFAAAYYADLFRDFNVQLVVRACAADYSTAPFLQSDIAVEDFHLDQDTEQLLSAMDRFLTLSENVPGALAIHGGRADLGFTETILAAYLVRVHGFRGQHATAWIRLVHPSPSPTFKDYQSHHQLLDQIVQPRRNHSVFQPSGGAERGM